ncbi:hypothetical protein OGATHE_006305 [Ogataea polymorpha]|uniref:DNA helicase n=1 Tax=Ogataea polymorpha TaxID=460523 RepID=A0A9P8SZD7_9ASCO|nr:hypothetical protein OGATHE_006305 [Ogataea polymorpha]
MLNPTLSAAAHASKQVLEIESKPFKWIATLEPALETSEWVAPVRSAKTGGSTAGIWIERGGSKLVKNHDSNAWATRSLSSFVASSGLSVRDVDEPFWLPFARSAFAPNKLLMMSSVDCRVLSCLRLDSDRVGSKFCGGQNTSRNASFRKKNPRSISPSVARRKVARFTLRNVPSIVSSLPRKNSGAASPYFHRPKVTFSTVKNGLSSELYTRFVVSKSSIRFPNAMPAKDSRLETSSMIFCEVIKAFKRFILEFRVDNQFIYRDQLRENILVKQYQLTVHNEHLISYNDELNKKLMDDPSEMVPLFERAITEIARRIIFISHEETPASFPTCQLILLSNDNRLSIRNLDSEHISKIVKISGIVISASTLHSKATDVTLMCRSCRHTMKMKVGSSFGAIQTPKSCQSAQQPNGEKNQCPPDPYIIVHDKSVFIDQQVLKLQETTDMVPIGEMPRHILLSVDRNLCNRVIPGTRCDVVGIYSIYQAKVRNGPSANNVAIRNPYMNVLGIQTDRDAQTGGLSSVFSEEEEEEFLSLARSPNLYERFSNSIAPSIYGNADIKKAIVCLLMGGSKKILPDGMRLRGDINVLLLGDPGTAKSQLLKFVEKVSPISLYTSGKGSSAAGLTASVQRDPTTRDFYLEGGAMVLADGGVVCIDEFDKMRDEDRVAIHEAMEQQTISIAKAGITTVLNSRTSVLAAANPIFGRYDDMKSPGENIDFQTTILSRFDMIFIVKDEHNQQRDEAIAHHVMNIHTNGGSAETQVEGEIPLEKMKRYIQYCKVKCAPRLSYEASEMLSSHFVGIRKEVKNKESHSTERSSIPITIRQLEAIIRITEALAKLELSPVATERHVEEAIRLFNASTMDAVHEGNSDNAQITSEIHKIESEIKRRLPLGWSTSYATLRRQFVEKGSYSLAALEKALNILERKETIQLRHQRSNVFRCGLSAQPQIPQHWIRVIVVWVPAHVMGVHAQKVAKSMREEAGRHARLENVLLVSPEQAELEEVSDQHFVRQQL